MVFFFIYSTLYGFTTCLDQAVYLRNSRNHLMIKKRNYTRWADITSINSV